MSPIRPAIRNLASNGIAQVAGLGLGDPDIVPLWFGESDQPTPEPIRRAAAEALTSGRTYYTHNLGRADLRAALSGYLSGLHGRPIGAERWHRPTTGGTCSPTSGTSLLPWPVPARRRFTLAPAPRASWISWPRLAAT